ncbi:MAG TPA: ImmA/IrrE family metallo-endopeptidase [Actinomycetota bacterium]|nr:ImmA/IrrE family metallo-endopeptidase [Actinomycetota bacterium]
MQECAQCGHELEPFFDSTCEPPVAWLCATCRRVTLEQDLRVLSPSARRDLAALQAFMAPDAPDERASKEGPTGLGRAHARARAILENVRSVPVDIERIAAEHGYPVRERSLRPEERGTIARDGHHTVIVINRDRIGSAAERRWVIAEELGHAVLEHSTLVASAAPERPLAVPEPRRRAEEREARRFAAEVLMPEEKVRGRFAELAPRIYRALGLRQRQAETDEVIAALAGMFAVSQLAMRIRLEELRLIQQ